MLTTNELREKYLLFFQSKGCVRKPSDVLVPRWDPSVLFTPAGMNQFKDHFLGRVKLEFTRATTCQKCLRTGDIDNVGRTAYHHTFFEMLGNFSFSDYFKREAINWAWEFLTSRQWLGIDPSKLSVTVYKDDHEAAGIWLKDVGLQVNRLKYLEEDENFWPASAPSQGPDGVCGPCSEIYHDTPVGPVEIWNLVFTQFNRVGEPPNNLRPLPSKNIDTGMGLERCAAVLQGVDTNYHIDILRPLVETAGDVLGVKYNPADDNGRRLRRIADHIRACTFAVHENVYPGNKEEKYVIRRLLRRAVLDGRFIKAASRMTAVPFLYQLVAKVAELMSVPYPELSETTGRVAEVIKKEEENFLSTVDNGIEKLEKIFSSFSGETCSSVKIPGTDIFDMYQTFGFPPELFEQLATERGYTFDWAGFKREMEHHGEVSGSAEKNLLFKKDPLESIKKQYKRTEFVGYEDGLSCEAKVIAILQDGKLIDEVVEGTCSVILDKTPFYGEKGGQVGDKGTINSFTVDSAQLDGELTVHIGMLNGTLKTGDTVTAAVDKDNRQAIQRSHSATHLLHYVLRQMLGGHAEQQGSKVDADVLRFDFTHHSAIDKDTLQKIELRVNKLILAATEGSIREMPIDEARKTGAMMLFGEKYPEKVRVVKFGDSVELCGGTHLHNTSETSFFKIISEESVSAGTRRITAYTGLKAVEDAITAASRMAAVSAALKVSPDNVEQKIADLQSQIKKLQKENQSRNRQAAVNADDLIKEAEMINGIKFIAKQVDADNTALGQLIEGVRGKSQSIAILLASVDNSGGTDVARKISLVAGLTKDIAGKYSAGELIKRVAPLVGGKGGGRPDFAQGGGILAEPLAVADAIEKMFAEAKAYFE